MKSTINMINTPSPQEHHAVYTWYKHSMYAIAALCALCALINAYQYYELVTQGSCKRKLAHIKQEVATTTQSLTNIRALENQMKEHAQALHAPSSFQPALYLTKIAQAIPDDTCLTTADLTPKGGIQLSGSTQSADSLKIFIEELKRTQLFKGINLTNLQPETTDSTLLRFGIQVQLQSVQD